MRRLQEMLHAHRRTFIRRQKRGIQRNATDIAAGHTESGEFGMIELLHRRGSGKDASPDEFALLLIGKRKLHHETETARERDIERRLHIGRQNRQSAVGLHPLQEITHLDIRVPIMAVAHLAAFPEQRIGTIGNQSRVRVAPIHLSPKTTPHGVGTAAANGIGQELNS